MAVILCMASALSGSKSHARQSNTRLYESPVAPSLIISAFFVPEDQACPVQPRSAEDDDLARPAVQVMQQERPWAERHRILAGKRRIGTEKAPCVVRVNRPPDVHYDHVAALRLVHSVEAGGLVVRLV